MKHIVIIVVMSIIMTNTFAAIKIDGELSEPVEDPVRCRRSEATRAERFSTLANPR